MNFSFSKIDADLFLVEKEYMTKTDGHGSDVSGPYWMLIECELPVGSIWWPTDGERIHADERCFIFVPPFSWTTEHYKAKTHLKIRGLISRRPLPALNFDGAILFQTNKALPRSQNEVRSFLKSIKHFHRIDLCTRPSALSQRAKSLIDSGYADSIEIGEIARKLKTSPAVLTRAFKKDFGKSPAFYRKGLKVTVGMYELMMGTPPVRAAEMAGYNDLGRFYKQFKSYLKQTPGEYLEKSKNAKKKPASKTK